MAEGSTGDENRPGVGMKLTMSMINKKFPKARNMDTQTLADRLQSPASKSTRLVLLDCRPEEEFSVSHIEGAVRVDCDATADTIVQQAQLDEISTHENESADVVCYCSVGYRSSMVVTKLQDHYSKTQGENRNLKSFFNLRGSIFKWANERRKMIDCDGKRTVFAHPYNSVFGKLLDSDLRKYHP